MDLSENEWERLERYVSGRGTPDELSELERWVNASAELRAIAHGMRTAGRLGDSAEAWDADSAWRRVSRRMRWFARPALAPIPTLGPRRWIAWAAAAAILAIGSTAVLQWHAQETREGVPSAGPPRQVITRRGERAAFNLADGSRIVLGAESRLEIPADYNASPAAGRHLFLEGEAYFVVRHDSTRQFRVQTARGVAEDLGTEFVVSAYPETRAMEVVVASGAVALRRPVPREAPVATPADTSPLLTLAQGDLARLDSSGVAILTRGADIRPLLAWTEGVLVFQAARLRDVLPRLARWYDLDIHLTDSSLADRRLTATFHNEAAPQVLRLVALSLDLEAEQRGGVITLSPRRRGRTSP